MVKGEKPEIIRKNIEHYRVLLKSETDASKRRVITKLLEEALRRLAKRDGK